MLRGQVSSSMAWWGGRVCAPWWGVHLTLPVCFENGITRHCRSAPSKFQSRLAGEGDPAASVQIRYTCPEAHTREGGRGSAPLLALRADDLERFLLSITLTTVLVHRIVLFLCLGLRLSCGPPRLLCSPVMTAHGANQRQSLRDGQNRLRKQTF